MRKGRKFDDLMDLSPVTDEEFEELLNEPRKAKGRKFSSRKRRKY